MKKFVLCLVFIHLALAAWCQPDNSTCDGVIELGSFPYCRGAIYSNVGATPYDIMFDNEPSCFKDGPPSNDVWFGFITADERKEIVITISGTGENSITNLQAALYRGVCAVNSIALRQCAVSSEGETSLGFESFDLTPSAQYYIRVDNFGGDINEGNFTICIDEISDDLLISDGSTQLCSGRLFDSGGPTGNYGDNENYTFTICPSEFHQCLSFDLAYFNIEHEAEGIGEKINFYNGPDTDSPFISSIGADENSATAHGGGGSCYKVQADDCLTIEFISDGSFNLEGFEGRWQCSVDACESDKQIKISGNISTKQIEDAITTPLSKVRIDTIICDKDAYGTFNGGNETDLGLHRGLLLTTGSPFSAIGPNNDDNITTINGTPGDNDLDILSQLNGDGSTSNDACIVEMEVEVFSNELTFEYIFASDEYPEFVGETFNDIFALLISGPGIEGVPEIGNQKNLATLPNGEFVQINSVNHLTNWEYYRNNTYGRSIEYDGMTSGVEGTKKSLTASTEVIPCNTYKLKLAIADRGDFAFDSGVFIAEISSGVPAIGLATDLSTDYLIEKCSGDQDQIMIMLNRPLSSEVKFKTAVSGTATRDTDYRSDIPEEIIFSPGQTSLSFSISPFSDDLPEGSETIIIKLINETECGTVALSELAVELRDEIEVNIDFEKDTIQTCLDGQLQLSANGAKEYNWASSNKISDPSIATPIISVDEEGWVYVKGSLGNSTLEECVATDSIFIEIVDPSIEITELDKVNYCQGERIDLAFHSNANSASINWNSDAGNIVTTNNQHHLDLTVPGLEQTITIEQITGGCISSDTMLVNVDEFFFPKLNFIDTTVCQSTTLKIVPFVIPSSTIYQWDSSPGLSSTDIADPLITAEQDQVYTLTATSKNGYCKIDTTLSISIMPNEIEIEAADTIRICKGDTIDIDAMIVEAATDNQVTWFFDRAITDINGLTFQELSPDKSGYLRASLSAGTCTNADSIYIQIDDLPDLDIKIKPDRNSFCEGEIVTFLSGNFTNSFYPDISFEWLDIAQANNNLNLAISTTESRYYIRNTTNGSCSEVDSVFIEVLDFDATINITDTLICPGTELSVIIDSAIPPDEIIWNPDVCDEELCEVFTFAPTSDQTYEILLKAGGCSDTLSFEVQMSDLFVTISSDIGFSVPIGAEVELTAVPSIDYSGSYSWFVNGILQNETSEIIRITINELSEIEVILNDEMECTNPLSKISIEAKVPEIKFPNAFNPSGNERNKIFTFAAILDGKRYERVAIDIELFEIFNRWGEQVFDCDDQACLARGWDGSRNGTEEPSAVYAYLFKGVLPDGTEVIRKGNVTLIR